MRLLVITQKVDTADSVLGFFHRWLIEFAKHAKHITVICLEEGVHALPDNVAVYSLGKERGVSKVGYILRFFKHIVGKRNQYDMVFIHMNPIYGVLGGLVWTLLRKPMYLWYTHKHVDLKLRIAALFATKIFTASPEGCRVGTRKLVVLGHGIDTNHFTGEAKDFTGSLTLTHIGRITPIKNCDTLIDACSLLRTEHGIDASVHFVGEAVYSSDKKYKAKLEEQIQAHDLDTYVHFDGPVTYDTLPTDVYKKSDIVVNLTPTGGLDKVVLEAYASNRYALTSNDAYGSFFGSYQKKGVFELRNASDLAEKIIVLKNGDQEMLSTLRKKVRSEYGIEKLIGELLNNMNYVRD